VPRGAVALLSSPQCRGGTPPSPAAPATHYRLIMAFQITALERAAMAEGGEGGPSP
jgi:hypothetical protein